MVSTLNREKPEFQRALAPKFNDKIGRDIK